MKRSYFRKEELPFAILWPTSAAVKGGSLQGLKIVFNWGCLLYSAFVSFNWMGHLSDNEFHLNWIEWASSHMIWTTSFRITHAGLTCEQIITQVRISSTSTNGNGTNNCDLQNPTHYKLGGVELVKEEPLTRATTSNRSDQHLQLGMESTLMKSVNILQKYWSQNDRWNYFLSEPNQQRPFLEKCDKVIRFIL